MEKAEIHCNRCNDTTLHTIRLYETKTKHYSVVSFGSDQHVSCICHTCLLESEFAKNIQKELIEKYNKQLAVSHAYELMEQNKQGKAEKIFRNILKNDGNYDQAAYGLSKCLINQNKYDEAKNYVDKLEIQFPNLEEVIELKKSLENIKQ